VADPAKTEASAAGVLTLIRAAMERWIEIEREALVQAFTKEFETRLRSVAASTVLKLHSLYTVERMGTEIVIRIQIEDKTK
jgi:hypothetical protein